MADFWQLGWRLILHYSWGAPSWERFDFSSTAELAAAIRRAQHDGRVSRHEHLRVRTWIGPMPQHVCGNRDIDWPTTSTYPCMCGVEHRHFKCSRCSIDELIPELGEDCGMIPWPGMGEEYRGRGPTWRPAKTWERR